MRNLELNGVVFCMINFIFGRFVFAKSKHFVNVNRKFIFIVYWLLTLIAMLILGGFDYVIHNILLIPHALCFGLGLFLAEKKTYFSSSMQLVSLILISLASSFFLNKIHHQYINFGNYTGTTNQKIGSKVVFYNLNDTLQIDQQKDKTLVVDFWNNTCAACIKGFPKYRDLKSKHANNPNVKFIIVNVYKSEKEKERALELLEMNNLSDMQTYFIHENDVKDFEIDGFPKLVVIKNKEIIFNGFMDTLSIFDFMYFK
jgi:thiol-disulfide isomerase/thioredoxin